MISLKLESSNKLSISSMVKWLESHDCDQHGLGLKPTCTVLLCPFIAFSPAWWCWQAVQNFSHIIIKTKKPKLKISTKQQYLGISGSRSE